MNRLYEYGLTDRFSNEASMYKELTLARVIAQYRGMYRIAVDEGELLGEISGKLRYETNDLGRYPAVGDFVMVSYNNLEDRAVIHKILTRKSVFLRKAVGVTGEAQVIASNIDTIFICMSLNNNYSLNRLERYLAIVWDSGATPVVVLTKSDLTDDLERYISEAEGSSGYCDIINVSMYDTEVAEKFKKYIRPGTTSAFIGSSGVDKSTLINSIIGEDVLETGEIGRLDKGRHTTTGRELFKTPLGGAVIDTPGLREVGAVTVDLSKSFEDIEELARECKFSDCTHTGEQGCALIKAVEEGRLTQRRLDSFIKLLRETDYDGLNSREIESKKIERMYKDFGGIKNAKRMIKNKK